MESPQGQETSNCPQQSSSSGSSIFRRETAETRRRPPCRAPCRRNGTRGWSCARETSLLRPFTAPVDFAVGDDPPPVSRGARRTSSKSHPAVVSAFVHVHPWSPLADQLRLPVQNPAQDRPDDSVAESEQTPSPAGRRPGQQTEPPIFWGSPFQLGGREMKTRRLRLSSSKLPRPQTK